jgi:hypothetical protein
VVSAWVQVPLQLVVVSGPAQTVDSFSSELGGGAVEISVSAAAAGKYTLALAASGTAAAKNKVPGTLAFTVTPGPVCVEKSVATVRLNQHPEPAAGGAAGDVGTLKAAAGDHLALTISAKDEFGNDTTLAPGEAFAVVAVGTAEKVFTRAAAPLSAAGGKSKAPLTYEATVAAAGVYAVHVNYKGGGGGGGGGMHAAPSEAPTRASRAPPSVHGGGGGTAANKPKPRGVTKVTSPTAVSMASSPENSPPGKLQGGGGAGTLEALNAPVAAALAGWPRMLTVRVLFWGTRCSCWRSSTGA